MHYSEIEQNFKKYCHIINKDINSNIFINMYEDYFEQLPSFKNIVLKGTYKAIHDSYPTIDFSFSARFKSERSFLIKTIVKIASNIVSLFPDLNSKSSDEHENIINKRTKTISKCLGFLLVENPSKFHQIKSLIENIPDLFGTSDPIKCFSIIFNELSDEEKDLFVEKLGQTEDLFAFCSIIRSIRLPINEIIQLNNGNFAVIDNIDNSETTRPILTSITIDPEKDIISDIDKNGEKFIIIDGKKEKLNERNLVYPSTLPSSQRYFDNALRNPDGTLTLLQDSIVLTDSNTILDIESIEYDENKKCHFLITPDGERRNLTSLIQNGNVQLLKHDHQTLSDYLNIISTRINNYLETIDVHSIPGRRKYYNQNPKPDGYGNAIHDSHLSKSLGYKFEYQLRDIKTQDDAENDDSNIGHDLYKKRRTQSFEKNPILASILTTDKTAFDSSSPTLMQLLRDSKIPLKDILPHYILVNAFSDNIISCWDVDPEIAFRYLFPNAQSPSSEYDLDFSSYENFLASKYKREQHLKKESSSLQKNSHSTQFEL